MTRPFVLAVLMVISAISCKKKDDPSTIPATPVEKGKMELVSGDGQIGTPGMHLYDSIVIKITPNKPGDEKHYTYSFKTINSGYIIANAYMVNGSYYVKGTWEVGGDATEQATFYLYADCKQLTCSPLDSLTIHATVASPWDPVFKNTGSYGQFWDLHFSDAKHGIVVGDGSESYITTDDGGATWTSKNAIRSDFYQLAFSGGDTGIAIVASNNAYFTNDGGATFTSGPWTPPTSGNRSSTYCMLNKDTIFSVGVQGQIAKSVDGGASWKHYTGFNFINTLNSICNIDGKTLFACGQAGMVIRTTDGGETWQEQPVQVNNNLQKIYFLNTNVGFAAGEYGAMIRTVNGGRNWTVINTGLHFSILQIRFFSDNTGYIVSAAGEISKTIDGGVTWQPIVIADNGVFSLNKVCIKDSTIVFALQNNDVYTYTLP
jgi:photosystem II stability/assembly factor-like uncharacterized protein